MLLTKEKLMGNFVAMVTPTDSNDNVNRQVAKQLSIYLIDAGVNGLVPLGGTGEFTSLTNSDRVAMVESVVEASAGRVPVIAGVLNPGFKECIESGLAFKKAGADGILLITPFYYRPSQKAICEYIGEFVAKVDLPTVLYEIPYRTGVTLDPDTYGKIVEQSKKVIGMKACNLDILHFYRTQKLVGDKIAVLSGDEYLFPAHIYHGAKGALMASSNIFPRAWGKLCELCKEGKFDAARNLHAAMLPFLDAVFAEGNPGPLKEAMKIIGFEVGVALRPLIRPSQSTIERVIATAKALIEDPIECRLGC
jgi:4-hydroxy-tetrahydrodipicolinate synthase